MGTSHAADQPSSTGAQPNRTDADLVLDAHGIIVRWSAEAHDLLGYSAADVCGRPAAHLVVRDPPEMSNGRTEAAGSDPTPTMLRHKDGHVQACQVLVGPSEEQPGGWTVTVRPTPAPETTDARDLDEAVLEALFSQSPISLCVYDCELRLRRFNPAARGKQGIFSHRALGLMPHEMWPDSNAEDFETRMAEVLRSGDPLTDFDKRGRPPSDPEHEHIFANAAFRLRDHAGHILGLATTSVEITEQRRAEERLGLLSDASTLIGTCLDVMGTGQQLADIAVPGFADAAAVDVLAPVIAGGEPGPSAADLRRIGLRHPGPPGAHDCDSPTGHVRYPYPPSAAQRLADAEPCRTKTVLPGDAGEPLYRGSAGERPAHSLVAPLCARGVVLGLVTFYRLGMGDPFSDFDVLTARDLASRAALAIDNARRYVREHSAARALQRDLLPRRFPQQSAVETAHYFAPTAAGADWFDVIPLSGSRVALVMATTDEADLSGAAAIGRLGAAVHALAAMDLAPDEALARLDMLVSSLIGESPADSTRRSRAGPEMTCVYAVYDPVSGHLALASAGHPLPVVTRPDGSAVALGPSRGSPLGAADGSAPCTELDLPTGSTLAFYNPTLETTAGSDARAASHAIAAAVSGTAGSSLEQMRNKVVESALAGSSAQGALLLVRTRHLDGEDIRSWDLPSDPAIVATARDLVQRQLALWGLDQTAFITELVASELVTNAIRYAQGPIRLRLIRDRSLICEVSDATTTAPHLRHARSGDEGGRGLYLVAQLTQRWGTRFSGTGKTIWTEQDIEHDTSP